MAELRLSEDKHVTDVLQATFSVRWAEDVGCALGREKKVLHSTELLNVAGGVKLRDLCVEYKSDTSEVNLCAELKDRKCDLSPGSLTVKIQSAGAAYWAGEQKVVNVRICIPDDIDSPDFNVSYTISAIPHSRDAGALDPITMDENLYVDLR